MSSSHFRLIFLTFLLFQTLSGLGQGYVQVATFRDPGEVRFQGSRPLRILIRDQDGFTPVFGASFRAQLYAGPAGTADADLLPVGEPLRLDGPEGVLSPAREDEVGSPKIVAIPGVPAGSSARVQLRVWRMDPGTESGWEASRVRAASSSFDTGPLARTREFPSLVPMLDAMETFQLSPKLKAVSRDPGLKAYSWWVEGAAFLVSPLNNLLVWNGTEDAGFIGLPNFPEPVPADIRNLTQVIRTEGPEAVAGWQRVGIAQDSGMVLLNQFHSEGSRVHLWNPLQGRREIVPNLDQAFAISDAANYMVGRQGQNLVRYDAFSGDAIPLMPLPAHGLVIPPVRDLSSDGTVILFETLEPYSRSNWLWSDTAGMESRALPEGFYPNGLSGDGRFVLGSLDGRPAYLDRALDQLRPVVVGPEGSVGQLHDANSDGSLMVGRAQANEGVLSIFNRIDGKGIPLNHLLPDAELSQVDQVDLTRIVERPDGSIMVQGKGRYLPAGRFDGVARMVTVVAKILPEAVMVPRAGLIQVATVRMATQSAGPGGDGFRIRHIYDQDGRTPLDGPRYSAQLLVGSPETPLDAMVPVGMPVTAFVNGALPDTSTRAAASVVEVPMVAPGERAKVVLRVWANGGEPETSWELARIRGQSEPFLSLPLASGADPSQRVPVLEGMKPFQLLPSLSPLGGDPGLLRLETGGEFLNGLGSVRITTNASGERRIVELQQRTWGSTNWFATRFVSPFTNNTVVATSSDGQTVVFGRSNESPGGFLLRRGEFHPVPPGVGNVIALSGDGRWAVCVTGNGISRSGWTVRRVDLAGMAVDHTVLWEGLRHDNPSATPEVKVASDGGAILLTFPEQQLWTEAGGTVRKGEGDWPDAFHAFGISGNGRVLVGQVTSGAAFMTRTGSPWGITPVPQSQNGLAFDRLIASSSDGTVMVGRVLGADHELHVFTASGAAYRFRDLLPGIPPDLLEGVTVTSVSPDGRTIRGTARVPITPASLETEPISWSADLVFPRQTPILRFGPVANGRLRIRWNSRPGENYRLHRGTSLNSAAAEWPWISDLLGTGSELGVDLDMEEDTGWFRLQSQPSNGN